jgi:hypothetical protein
MLSEREGCVTGDGCENCDQVLAAALVEGALAFVVKHARAQNLGVFASTDFSRPTTSWSIDDLIKSAARGNDTAILTEQARLRAANPVSARQRFHAGRMLADFPQGVPDLRPEEAQEAKAIAELVVRRVLDWLEKHPPSGAWRHSRWPTDPDMTRRAKR